MRVNQQFLCWMRNQHELPWWKLSALLPKEQLYQYMTRKPCSFLFVYYLKPRNEIVSHWKEKPMDGAQLPGTEAVCQLDADQRTV